MGNKKVIQKISGIIEEEFGKRSTTLIDVGAAQGASDRWSVFKSLIKTVGFEPGKAEFEKLQNSESEIWINTAISSKMETRPIYLTKYWSNTSLLKPNQQLLDTLAWGDDHRVMSEETVACETLDHVAKANSLDFDYLKIDTQGTELEILHGATASLSSVLSVEMEVEFASLYQHQPLFSDIDPFMVRQGFFLQDLGSFLHVKPRAYPTMGGPRGRIISADALYLRDPLRATEILEVYGARKIAALLVAYLVYGFPELCLVAIDTLHKSNHHLPWLKSMETEIKKIQHLSEKLHFLPGKRFLARAGRKIWQHIYNVNGSLWDSPLGNDLR